MPVVLLHLPDGTEQRCAARDGHTLMQAATGHGVDGIVAECGGSGICATCHVEVADAWIGRLPPPDANEQAMLDLVATGRQPGSRLSCQIRLTPDLDGLVVTVPERQY